MATTRRKCSYKSCTTIPRTDRYGGYCYEHRNYSIQYVVTGGDRRRIANARRVIGGKKRWIKSVNRGLELPPYDSAGEHIASHVGVSNELGRRIGYVLGNIEAPHDTTPEWVEKHSGERLDKAGKMLVSSGVDVKDIGLIHTADLKVSPYSGSAYVRGRLSHLPQVEHDALIVRDPKGKNSNIDRHVVLDPNIAMLAPVDRSEKGKPLNAEDFPPGLTPFDEGMYISDLGSYLSGPQISWGKYKIEWL